MQRRGNHNEATEVPPLPPSLAAKPAVVPAAVEEESEDAKWLREQLEADAAAEKLLEEEGDEDEDEGEGGEDEDEEEGGDASASVSADEAEDGRLTPNSGSKREAPADDSGATEGRGGRAKRVKGQGRDDTGGGWEREKAQKVQNASVGADGGDATYKCRACQHDLPPDAFNAKVRL